MHIQSTNIAEVRTILWQNKEVTTGIFKTPTPKPIYLGQGGVKEDYVADTKVHGGHYKACYLFSTDHYPYWKKLYPNLAWNWGMFGENLTVNGLNETQIRVGDIYKIGNALVQVTQPREPCFKFGVKFGTQEVLKQFIAHGFPGTYVCVLEEGLVQADDNLKLISRLDKSLSVAELYNLIFSKHKDQQLLKTAISLDVLPERKRKQLEKFIY
ncbi:MOSC domain-containing protein [Hyunsoonleella pacifica]|uniref:MOSC domain-containing protein n=1 Tax=Hyunsoonleella pacifica TaxID=1080224 RepID=A0A4Q9FIW8_9FLAO|nr:MOSC domain-containing protein [Hyunsoonleella pacifica]TBN12437.1 MOSC domain-containing protein [Hyunsoonleella pacifica]GGD29506.1 molybdenum cofactor biosysynthesis protein [Hyunsoonleella pacifica]